jgi:hypothetical protein
MMTWNLSLTLFYNLPWRISDRHTLTKTAMIRTFIAKMAFTIPAAIPLEFHKLLDFARNSKGRDITDHLAEIRVKIHNLASSIDETQNKPIEVILEDLVFTPELVERRACSDSRSTLIAIVEWTSIAGTRTLGGTRAHVRSTQSRRNYSMDKFRTYQ